MKKKILLVLLVVLMVGILAFSVFACNDGKDPQPRPNPTPVIPDEPDDTDYLSEALDAVVTAIDNTLANVNDIDTAASVSADIVVKVAVGTETYDVALKVKGSIDEGSAAKNWALIEADVLGVEVALFAVNNGTVEDLYIAQNILNENVQWNKLSQFEQANVLSGLACDSILNLIKDIDDETADSLEAGLVSGFAGDILSLVGMVGALFQPAEGAANDFTTENGYGIGLNIPQLGEFLPNILGIIGGIDLGDATGLVNTIGGIVLGGTLDLGNGSFVAGAHVPTVEIGVGVEDDLFTGLSLKYAGKIALEEGADPTDIAINFGIENLSISGASKAAPKPFTGTPDELAIALNLDLTAQGITADTMTAQVAIYPNVAMTFDNDGYVDFDFSKLYAVATANIAGESYTIAEYNADGEEDLLIDLSSIVNVIGAEVPATLFKVPVNLQEKFDNMIAAQKAPKQDAEVQNAIDGNVVDHVIENIVPSLFDAEGNFQIGALIGVVGQLGEILEAITPILETEGLFDYAIDADEATASATLNLEVLMDALLVEDGIIDGITGEWNSFDLHYYDKYYDMQIWEDVVSYEYKEGLTLVDVLAGDNVIDSIIALVNTMMYEAYVENFVPANEGEEALSFVDYFASEGTPILRREVLETLTNITGAELDIEDAYTNMTVSVNGYAKDGIGFGLEATLGEQVKTFGLGLGLSIIENVAVEDYTQKIFFEEKVGYDVEYGGMETVYTEAYSNDTGKDGGKLLKYTALQIANSLVSFLSNYVDDGAPYGIIMEGGAKELAFEATLTDGSAVLVGGVGYTYYAITLEDAASITLTVDASAEGDLYNADITYTAVHPMTGFEMEMFETLVGEKQDPSTWQNYFAVTGTSEQAVPAGIVYVVINAAAPVSVTVTIA